MEITRDTPINDLFNAALAQLRIEVRFEHKVCIVQAVKKTGPDDILIPDGAMKMWRKRPSKAKDDLPTLEPMFWVLCHDGQWREQGHMGDGINQWRKAVTDVRTVGEAVAVRESRCK
jgi:hypothetical protein